MSRRPIPVHYRDGIGTACRLLITPTAKICNTTELEWVTCRKCLKALASDDLPGAALSGGGWSSLLGSPFGRSRISADRASTPPAGSSSYGGRP